MTSPSKVSVLNAANGLADDATARPLQSRQLVALEQRMLFDGSLGAGSDATADAEPQTVDTEREAGTEGHKEEVQARQLLIIDPSVQDWPTLIEGLDDDVDVVVLDPHADALSQIAQAVTAREPISAVHVVSHGGTGEVLLGDGALNTGNVAQYQETLSAIGDGLTPDGDILLYGCNIGENGEGEQFLAALAQATSADIAASDDLTGAAAYGANWTLEANVGQIETDVAISLQAQQAFDGLLAPIPTVSIGSLDPAGWEGQTPTGSQTDPLLGEEFTFDVTFENSDLVDAGFAPYIDVFVPFQGADGGASPDGVTINGATFLGADVTQTVVTLSAADISAGMVSHPLYADAADGHEVSIPAGYQAGDQLVVFELPLGSFAAGQNAAVLAISATVSEYADVNTPLPITVRSGFRYGADALDNPSTDPTIQGVEQTVTVNPQLYRVRTTYIGGENETATGPNYIRAMRIDIDVASANTVDNVAIGAALSDAMQFSPVTGTPGTYGPSPSGAWSNVNGVLVSTPAADSGTPGAGTPGGNANRTVSTLTGSSATEDASMIVEFYVPEFDAAGQPVLNASSGDDALVTAGSTVAADWTPADARDSASSESVNDAAAIQFNARSIALHKTQAIISDLGAANLSAGDVIEYTLQVDVSDFFAVGGDATPTGTPGSEDFLITDTLSDGLDLIDSSTGTPGTDPSLTIQNADGTTDSYTLTRGVNYTVATQANGQQVVVFNLRSAVTAGSGLIVVGDLFDVDNTINSPAGATLVFQAEVLESYRIAPPDQNGTPQAGSGQLDLNEGDWVVNQATVQATILTNTLDPNAAGLSGEDDDSAVADQIESNEVTLDLVGLNGSTIVNDPGNPIQIGAGDCITYRLTYEVQTGDYEDLRLQGFLPLPVTNVSDPDADGTPSAWTSVGFTSNPGVGEFAAQGTGGDGTPILAPSLVADVTSNSLTFDFGDRTDTSNLPLLVEVYFTVCVNDQPFAPGLILSAQGVQEGQNTASAPIESASIDQFVFAAPEVSIIRGVVQDDVNQATSVYSPSYTPGDPTGLIRPAGDTNANPLTGVLSDTSITSLDTDLSNIDAGDQVRFAIVLDNQGRSVNGAFDVTFNDNLPANVDLASVTNLRIVRGDGTPINLTTDVRHAGGSLVTGEADALAGLLGAGLELVDPAESVPGAGGALPSGFDSAGNPVAAGANVIVITYDATIASNVNPGVVASSDVTLTNYAAIENGTDFTTEDVIDPASVATPLVQIDKTILGTSHAFTSDNNGAAPGQGDVVVGEIVSYQVVIQVPEGVTNAATFTDTLDANRLSFTSLDSIVGSAGVTFDSGAVFTSLTPSDAGGGSANRLVFNLGNITNANADNAIADTITLTYSAVVVDTAANQSGVLVNNSARINHSDGAVTDTAPNMRVVEPALTITNSPSVSFADADDTVTYTVTINSNGAAPAFDVSLADSIPAGMTYVGGTLAQTSGPVASTALTEAGGAINGGWTQLNVGEVVTYQFQATIDSSVSIGATLDHTATADWTSVPGGASDLSPFTTIGDQERTGAGGVDDYIVSDDAPVTVLFTPPELFIVNSSEASTAGSIAAPGEIIRYRMVVQMPEASAPGFELHPALPPGLRYVNDGSTTVGFIADGPGINSSTLAGVSLNLTGGGADPASVAGVTPSLALTGSAIVDGTGSAVAPGVIMASGDQPIFQLGDLVNSDTDANGEFIVVEFNAVVENEASNTFTSPPLSTTFDYHTAGTYRETSNNAAVTIGEPAIVDVDKTVASVSGSTITYQVTFTNSGGEDAHNVRIVDDFANAAANENQTFDGAPGVTAPGGTINNSTGSALDLEIPVVSAGGSVTITYTTTAIDPLIDQPLHAVDVTYSSLSSAGESLDTNVQDGAGVGSVVTTVTTGERTGDSADYGGVANTYSDSDNAGLGTISGQLWDDTANDNDIIDAGETLLSGVTVELLWAGADGVYGNADDQSSSTVTDAQGRYQFGLLPGGNYRMTTAVNVIDAGIGPLVNTFDRGPLGSTQGDAITEHNLFEGEVCTDHDFGYVRQNESPTVAVPGSQSVDEDSTLTLSTASNSAIQIGDPDLLEANNPVSMPNNFEVVLGVGNGVLNAVAAGSAAVAGANTNTVTVTGSLADINATLDGLEYVGDLDFNGNDAINIVVNDHGNYGDADGDGVPNESVDDNLFATASVPIVVDPVPDPPVANPDARTTDEDTPISGNALVAPNPGELADTDPDIGNGDSIAVCGVQAGNTGAVITDNTGVGALVPGVFGAISVDAAGNYTYTPGAAANAIQAGTTVQDTFTYTICDTQGHAVSTTITISITGVDDVVNAQPDAQSMGEDDPPLTGNAISGGAVGDQIDTDPEGELITVVGIEAGNTGGTPATGVGSSITGTYGDIVIATDGSYTYTTNAAAQSIALGTSQTDVFTYSVTDPGGNVTSTTITITIVGDDDNLLANPDKRTITEAVALTPPITGDVVNGGALGEQVDVDIDADPISVVGVQVGTASGPLTNGVGASLTGTWGVLELIADGTYTYTPGAQSNAIAVGVTEVDVFTYTVSDGNGTSTTTLTICLDGTNDAPTANPDTNVANGDGSPVSGHAITAATAGDQTDTDPDAGDSLIVDGVVAGNPGGPVIGGVGTGIVGAYGSLTLNADGSYSYAANPNNPTILALDATGTIDDVFTYTVTDGNDGFATTTITITVGGVDNPPDAVDSTFTISEDLVTEAGVPLAFTAADFGFNDPDSGDSFTALTIDSIPQSGVLSLNGTAVTIGQLITTAELSNLTYVPALDANNLNLPALPGFTFRVHDTQGNTDPVANTITIDITPVADPPVAPVVNYLLNASAQPGDPETQIPAFTAPSDPDQDLLTITISALPPIEHGFFCLDGTAVTVGQVLTQAQLQELSFKPNAGITVLPDPADGNIAAGALLFTVDDGTGRTATGEINIRLRPVNTIIPTSVDPFPPEPYEPLSVSSLSPTIETVSSTPYRAGDGYFYEPGDQVFQQILSEPPEMSMLSPIANSRPWDNLQDLLDAEKNARVKAASEAVVDEDCEAPKHVKPKAKPLVIKRSVLSDTPKPASFSEQLKKESSPIKVRKPARIC